MKTTKADLSLLPLIFPFSKPENVPVKFTIGEKKYIGFPSETHPVYKRRRIDSHTFLTDITAVTEDGLELSAECVEYTDFAVVEWTVSIKNISDKNSKIISDWRIGGEIAKTSGKLEHSNGDTCNDMGYEWWTEDIKDGFDLSPCGDGTSCNGAFPYMRLIYPDCCINAAIGWTGTWCAQINNTENGTNFLAGQKNFRSYLKPGELVRTPRLTLQICDGGTDRARNLWRSFCFEHVVPRENGKPLDPKLVVHTWMIDGLPEFCGVTEENQIKAINTYLEKGFKPDIWWIDAGWYPCNNDWPTTGTWIPHPEHFPNGMGPVGKLCDDKNIELLVWFEPERVRKNTDLWNKHPDWLLFYKRDENEWYNGNALLDLGNKEALDWLIDTVDKIIKDSHIRIYRQDFNFAPELYWSDNQEENRAGILENLHIQGYYAYWDALIERNPGLWMDSCSSGGRRNDFETMRRAVPLHYTDVGYGHHLIKQKQHREMFEWIPYFRAHTMNWDTPEGVYGGSRPVDEFAYQNAVAPSVTSMIEWNDSDELFEVGRRFHPVWRKAAEMELKYDYYPLTECRKEPTDWYALQFDGEDKGFIQIIRNIHIAEDSFTAKMHVDKDKNYVFTNPFTGEVREITGTELAEDGFTDTLPPRSGKIWFYKKIG